MKRLTFFTATEPNTLGTYCRRACTAIFILFFMIVLANSAKAQSTLAGRYSGEWTSRVVGTGVSPVGEPEHEGTWDITIDSGGNVVGTEIDKTAEDRASLKGFIDEEGYIQLTLNNSEGANTIKGTLERRGTRLIGTLKQYCSPGSKRACAVIEMILNRQNRPTTIVENIDPGCLPKRGILSVKMKDGSVRRIDLSQADEITIEP